MIAEAEQTIAKMEQMKHADQSDICTLRGFLYMVRIVQNPAQNGQRYYIDVMQNFEKALKLNPDNLLAKQLQQKFFEGMKQQTENLKWNLFMTVGPVSLVRAHNKPKRFLTFINNYNKNAAPPVFIAEMR